MRAAPLLRNKFYEQEAMFTPENLLREARRQRGIPSGKMPEICMLDPDGDLVRYLRRTGKANMCPAWACYHTSIPFFFASFS